MKRKFCIQLYNNIHQSIWFSHFPLLAALAFLYKNFQSSMFEMLCCCDMTLKWQKAIYVFIQSGFLSLCVLLKSGHICELIAVQDMIRQISIEYRNCHISGISGQSKLVLILFSYKYKCKGYLFLDIPEENKILNCGNMASLRFFEVSAFFKLP